MCMLFFVQIQSAAQELKANSSKMVEAENSYKILEVGAENSYKILEVGAENSAKAGRCQQASTLKSTDAEAKWMCPVILQVRQLGQSQTMSDVTSG